MRNLMIFGAWPLLMLSACGTGGPEDTVKGFTKDVSANEIAAASEQLDPQLRQMGGPKILAGLSRTHDDMEKKGGLKSIEIVDKAIENDHGTVTTKISYGNGTSETSKANVRKVDGKWYITM